MNKATLAAIALLVAACAGSSATLPSPSSAPSRATPSPTPLATPTARPTCPPPAAHPSASNGQVTIEWWQVNAGKTGNAIWQDAANRYMAAHPKVKIKITLVDHTPTNIYFVMNQLYEAMNAGRLPDLLPSWGGGTMAAEADACMLRDITADVEPWKGDLNANALGMHTYQGRQYGIPWDLGIFGFWYNEALFIRAKIGATPQTWDEFLADVDRLKLANIVPYALGEQDQWTGLHLWTYLVLREGGSDALTRMISARDWNTEACVAGGRHVQELVAKTPFQEGYNSAGYAAPWPGEAGTMGDGRAAMELMGPWAETVQDANSANGKGVGANLGWFPFPAVTGGKGAATDAVGGSSGIAVGRDAPPEAIDFLRYLVSKEIQIRIGASGVGLPVTAGTASSVKDPLQKQILAARDQAGFIQDYLDQANDEGVNKAVNAATAGLFSWTSTPEEVCQAVTKAVAVP